MKPLISVLCALVSCIAFATCKKAESAPAPDRNALLTRGRWQLSGYMIYSSAGPYDNFTPAQPCIKDNTFTFGTDGHILEDEGPTKCDSSYPQQRRYQKWSLRDDGRLNWNDGNIVWFYTISQLDSNFLKLEWEGDDPNTMLHHRDVITYQQQ